MKGNDMNEVRTHRPPMRRTALCALVATAFFAPTDAAFKKVPKATLRAVQRNPKLLKRVLLYHVIKGKVPSTTVVTLKSAKTLAGPAVKIRVTGNRVFVNNARVTTVDVPASNGVIHVINRVLIPPK